MIRYIDPRITPVRTAVAVLTLFFVIGSVSLARSAQDSAEDPNNENPALGTVLTEYAAKFVCGVPKVEAQREAVKPGNYATAINIHNPNQLRTTAPIQFTKHAVLALQEDLTPVPPSAAVGEVLPSDFAMEVDCTNIFKLLGSPTGLTFWKGWLVILTTSPNQLDVVGVYSSEPPPSAAGGPPAGMGLEILPIAPRTTSK
jgi:hypothetical protein